MVDCRFGGWILELNVEVLLTFKGPDGQNATIVHSLGRIENEIDNNLGQYVRIGIDVRQVWIEIQLAPESSDFGFRRE